MKLPSLHHMRLARDHPMSDRPTVDRPLRDKDYIAADGGLLFNVVGYDHPPAAVYANLKYVDDSHTQSELPFGSRSSAPVGRWNRRKWRGTYRQAVDFLSQRHSNLIDDDGYVSVPSECVRQVHRSADGLRLLRDNPRRNELQQHALDLADTLSDHLGLPIDALGLTDSLLWSPGTGESDIDLVVFGCDAAQRLVDNLAGVYQTPEFVFAPERFDEPSQVPAETRATIAARRLHLGVHRGVKFSIRAVRSGWSLESNQGSPSERRGAIERVAEIASVAESLYFPATYGLTDNAKLVSYITAHEGVFRRGEQVRIRGQLLVDASGGETIVVGSEGESVC